MPNANGPVNEIQALEERRYRAMIDGDVVVLGEICSSDLIYTHSKGDHDDRRSYLQKVGSRYFKYHEITHPADRILVVDGAALVTGRMTAKVSVEGEVKHIDNRYLAVWARMGVFADADPFRKHQNAWPRGAGVIPVGKPFTKIAVVVVFDDRRFLHISPPALVIQSR
jgi:hypothetical protein